MIRMFKYIQAKSSEILSHKAVAPVVAALASFASRQTAAIFVATLDNMKILSVWLLESICIIGAVVMVWQAVGAVMAGQVSTAIGTAIAAVLLLVVCLMCDRYVSGAVPNKNSVK